MKLLQFLLLFGFLIFVNALNCEYGGRCYVEDLFKPQTPLQLSEQKTCEDFCVYFKCQVGEYKVMEGAGCHKDFDDTCKYTPVNLKDDIKGFFHADSSLIYVTCKDGDKCATKALDAMKITNPDFDKKFEYKPIFFAVDKSESCEYDRSPKIFKSSVKCAVRQNCYGGKIFIPEPVTDVSVSNITICDACFHYYCTSDSGKTIISGFGCLDHFYNACKTAFDTTTEFEENVKDSFYVDKNLIFISCSESDFCHTSEIVKKINVNSVAINTFFENVDMTSDGNCEYMSHNSSEYIPLKPETPPSQPETPPFQPDTPPSQPDTPPSPPDTPPSRPGATFTGICELSEVCHNFRYPSPNFTIHTKKCDSFCVYYKCLVDEKTPQLFNVKTGYGCFDDFVDACKYTGYQTKEKMKKGGSNYQYHDNKLIYVSCNNKDECAAEVVKKMVTVNPAVEKRFGYQGDLKTDGLDKCHPDIKKFNAKCDSKSWCKSGKEFKNGGNKDLWENPKNDFRGHDSCVSYMCTSNGKKIIGGSGTFNDFKKSCIKFMTNEQKTLFEENKNKNFFHADKNMIIMSLKDGLFYNGGLDLKVNPFETYLKLNEELVKPFYDSIDVEVNGTCADIDDPLPPSPPHRKYDMFECESGDKCHIFNNRLDHFGTSLKQCPGSCVYYKCLYKAYDLGKSINYNAKEGYGCFEDFVNACKYTGYQTKEKLKKSGPNYQYHDEGLIFLSCNNNDVCASEALKKMISKDSSIEKQFGDNLNSLKGGLCMDNFDGRLFDFRTTAWCKSGRQFKSNEPPKERSSSNKKCNPSISFMCSSDGKLIKGGVGCIEDIKIACKDVLSNDLQKQLEKGPGIFFYADKNIIVSASKGFYSENHFDLFLKINPELIKPFYDNIDGTSNEMCDYQKAEPKPHKSPENVYQSHSEPESLSSNQGTTFKVNSIFLYGITFINLLCMAFFVI